MALLVAALVGSLVACSSSDDAAAPTTTERPASSTTAEAAEPEAFDGSVEDFYRVPDPLPAGPPGQLIRTMPVKAPAGQVGLRVMYHSTDAAGKDRAVTGLVFYPTATAPEGGWPVLAWAHGTTGLVAKCAPSRGGGEPPAFGVEGVRVATDYLGLGPEGEVHPYLSAAAEGHAVIDSVAAARSIPEAHAGDEWVVVGVSQGGHAALVTNEQAAERLPDAKLLGAVALAPGAELGESYGDQIQIRVITTMVFVGNASEDPSMDLADYLSPDALAASKVITEGCVGDIIDTMVPFAARDDYFTKDPRTSPVGEKWVATNDPGQVKSDAPLLLVQGDQDVLVIPARTASLFGRECRLGQVTQMVTIPGADHDTVTPKAADQVSAWVADRFAGEPATDDC